MAPLMLTRRRPVFGTYLPVLAARYPAARDHRIVLRMDGIHEVNEIVLAAVTAACVAFRAEDFARMRGFDPST